MVARQHVRDYQPSGDMWPIAWIPAKVEAAKARYARYLEHEAGTYDQL